MDRECSAVSCRKWARATDSILYPAGRALASLRERPNRVLAERYSHVTIIITAFQNGKYPQYMPQL